MYILKGQHDSSCFCALEMLTVPAMGSLLPMPTLIRKTPGSSSLWTEKDIPLYWKSREGTFPHDVMDCRLYTASPGRVAHRSSLLPKA